MLGQRLLEFDGDLCDYILGNVRQYLRSVAERPKPTGKLRPSELDLLDFPEWFARQFSDCFASLRDRIWAGVFGEVQRVPLSESELYELAAVVDDLPDRLILTCVWEPYPALHAQYVACVAEIRDQLTRQSAEKWAEESAAFAARLCDSRLSLAEGISVVSEWVRVARRLRHAMGAARVLATASGASRPSAEEAKTTMPPVKAQTTSTREAAVCGWREAMDITGLKKTKLYDLFRGGVLKGYRDGRMIRFYRKGLADYMQERENITLPPPRPARRPRAAKSKALPGMRFRFL